MSDQITTTETRSWGSRLKWVAMGVVFGPILVIVGCIILWTNEGRSARMIEALSEGRDAVVTISPTSLDSLHEWALVHITGEARSSGSIQDQDTLLSTDALVLERRVEAYQWREKSSESSQNNMGGSQTTTTTYSYEKVWDDDMIDSTDFYTQSGHTNPAAWRYSSERLESPQVTIGTFALSSSIIDRIPAEMPLRLEWARIVTQTGEILTADTLYVGRDPSQPEIGDLRVTYFVAPSPSSLTILAQQKGTLLSDYRATSWSDLTRVSLGTYSAAEMFAMMEEENALLTWGLRGLGSLLVFIGAAWFLSIVPMLAMVLPFLGGLVGFGVNLVALFFAVIVSGVTIVLAWLVYRPVVSLIVITVTLTIAWGIWHLMRKQHPKNPSV